MPFVAFLFCQAIVPEFYVHIFPYSSEFQLFYHWAYESISQLGKNHGNTIFCEFRRRGIMLDKDWFTLYCRKNQRRLLLADVIK